MSVIMQCASRTRRAYSDARNLGLSGEHAHEVVIAVEPLAACCKMQRRTLENVPTAGSNTANTDAGII